jgi:hypothetical protein
MRLMPDLTYGADRTQGRSAPYAPYALGGL